MRSHTLRIMLPFVLLFLLVPAIGFAAPTQTEIDQYKTMIAQQAEADTQGVSAQDRAMAEKWLKEAEVLLASGDSSAATKRLRRVEFVLDLIRAMVAASEIRLAAEQQEAEAYQGPTAAKELASEIESLKRKKAELERTLKNIR